MLQRLLVLLSLTSATGFILPCPAQSQSAPKKQPSAISLLSRDLAQAQRLGKEKEVLEISSKITTELGSRAGVPELEDRYRKVPDGASDQLKAADLKEGFKPYFKQITQDAWWRRSIDPADLTHPPREIASIIVGCLAARRAGSDGQEKLLQLAMECGDYLLSIQKQGGHKVIPFPASRSKSGRPFEVAEQFMSTLERQGTLSQHVENGWIIDDGGSGGLNFDNGLAGLALFDLYDASKREDYKQTALATAEWTLNRPAVPNWNYNGFSMALLAAAYEHSGKPVFLQKAKELFRLGIQPGQLSTGPCTGRWQDPHNARPAYHYIIVRSLALLAAALPPGDRDRAAVMVCLQKALKARNFEMVSKGICNSDSAMEALCTCRLRLRPAETAGCGVDEALKALGSYSIFAVMRGNPCLSPGAWGLYLELRAREGTVQ